MKAIKLTSLLLCVMLLLPFVPMCGITVSADDDELLSRKTPIMGWASWNAYRTDISENVILSQAEKLKSLGLAELGYVFVNVDDGWQYGRGDDGFVNTNTTRFPSGMKSLSEKIHALGLKAGIYTDAGASTCGWASDNQTQNDDVGLLGHEESDLRRYLIDWDYDFIKVDWCGGREGGLNQKSRYTMIGNQISSIEQEIKKDKIYNVCCWAFPGEWVCSVADSWRTGGDLFNNFNDVMSQIDNIKSLAKYNTPGHVNDLDMMQVGRGMSYEEDKSHFSMWCMMSTPLMLGMDLCSISDETLSIITNSELIALDQDEACIQASLCATYGNRVEAWVKELGSAGSGDAAVAFLNRSDKAQTLFIDFSELGYNGVESVRDLWAHCDYSCDGKMMITVPSHGTLVYKLHGTPNGNTEPSDPETKDDGSVVSADCKIENKPKTINLSTLGNYDWAYFGPDSDQKKNSSGEIKVKFDGASTGTYDSAAATYRWSDGSNVKSGRFTSGFGVFGLGAYASVTTPCDTLSRTLSIAIGSFSADILVTVTIGGKVQKTETILGSANQKRDRLITLTYSSDIPTTATVRWEVATDKGSSASINIEGVALSALSNTDCVTEPEISFGAGSITVRTTASAKDDSVCIVAVKDTAGRVVALDSLPVNSEKWYYSDNSFQVGSGFAGTVEVFLWKDEVPLVKKKSVAVNTSSVSDYSIGPMTAKSLLSRGAVLVDVRTPEEYNKGHLDGAINIDYQEIREKAASLLPDKSKNIIVYCLSAKRSAQATDTLVSLGYGAVFNLGSMSNFTAEPIITFSNNTCTVVTKGEKAAVSYTASGFDSPSVYISCGENSTLADAVPQSEFTIPEYSGYYLTLKAYLVLDGVSYAECSKTFIYWSVESMDAFASDLSWNSSTCGWGTIKNDKSSDGNTIRIAGKTFAKGIGTHANSTIKMDIPAGMTKFLAIGGCDEEISDRSCRMILYVYIDGELVDESSFICVGEYYVFDIDIPAGAKEITLYAFEGTYGGNTCDHSDWAIAGFKNV